MQNTVAHLETLAHLRNNSDGWQTASVRALATASRLGLRPRPTRRLRRGRIPTTASAPRFPADKSCSRGRRRYAQPRTVAGLPSGVPPLEMARQRVGLKVAWMLHSTIRLSTRGCDLRHAPPCHFGLRPSYPPAVGRPRSGCPSRGASRSDTNARLRETRKTWLLLNPSFASSRTERS